MITLSFAGNTFNCWQDPEKNKSRDYKKTRLASGLDHVARGSRILLFPISFQCYADTQDEMDAVDNLQLLDPGNLIYKGLTFTNCFIFKISGKELIQDSGKWSYVIEFDRGDVF